jgi:hypothetical protein
MSDASKINASHLRRRAFVYLRQSSAAQVEHNRESTKRQYALASRATELGWSSQQVTVIDEDLGLSGSGAVERRGFARLAAEVGLGHVGIVLGLEVSRLARNNADWYRLLDLCGLTDTLIGDADGIYHPAMFNDRLLLGLKGTMSEAELHILRERLNGASATKPLAANCVADFPSASSGARRMARYASIPTNPCVPRSATSLSVSLNWAPRAASGFICDPKDCLFPCKSIMARPFVGSARVTLRSIMC